MEGSKVCEKPQNYYTGWAEIAAMAMSLRHNHNQHIFYSYIVLSHRGVRFSPDKYRLFNPSLRCVAKWTHAMPIAILSIAVSLLEIIDVKVNDLVLSRSRACYQMLSSNSFLPSRCSVFSLLMCSKMKIISFVFFPSRSWMWFIFRLNFALVYHFGWGCERISSD